LQAKGKPFPLFNSRHEICHKKDILSAHLTAEIEMAGDEREKLSTE